MPHFGFESSREERGNMGDQSLNGMRILKVILEK
jgi:hypothetical protein